MIDLRKVFGFVVVYYSIIIIWTIPHMMV